MVYTPLFDVTVSKARRVSEMGAWRCWPEFRGVSGASLLRETGAKQAHLGGIPLLAVHSLGICGESSLSRVGQAPHAAIDSSRRLTRGPVSCPIVRGRCICGLAGLGRVSPDGTP